MGRISGPFSLVRHRLPLVQAATRIKTCNAFRRPRCSAHNAGGSTAMSKNVILSESVVKKRFDDIGRELGEVQYLIDGADHPLYRL